MVLVEFTSQIKEQIKNAYLNDDNLRINLDIRAQAGILLQTNGNNQRVHCCLPKKQITEVVEFLFALDTSNVIINVSDSGVCSLYHALQKKPVPLPTREFSVGFEFSIYATKEMYKMMDAIVIDHFGSMCKPNIRLRRNQSEIFVNQLIEMRSKHIIRNLTVQKYSPEFFESLPVFTNLKATKACRFRTVLSDNDLVILLRVVPKCHKLNFISGYVSDTNDNYRKLQWYMEKWKTERTKTTLVLASPIYARRLNPSYKMTVDILRRLRDFL